MKPLFTVHAGEYLVGSYIEKHYKDWNVWVPSKDTGVDLLVTNKGNTKSVSLQVKYSKDFTQTDGTSLLQSKQLAAGWWNLQEKKITKSQADYWVFVLPSFAEHSTNYIIIQPAELLRRFHAIFGKSAKRFDSFLRVIKLKTESCWEVRGLKIADLAMIACDQFDNPDRDFTRFSNSRGWQGVERRLK